MWEDTVTNYTGDTIINNMLNNQAEITGKIAYEAGRESVLSEAKAGNVSVNDLIQEAKKAGMRTVVDKLVGHEKVSDILRHATASLGALMLSTEDSGSKNLTRYWLEKIDEQTRKLESLKEWGIEE